MKHFTVMVLDTVRYHFMCAVKISIVDHSWTIMMQGATIG